MSDHIFRRDHNTAEALFRFPRSPSVATWITVVKHIIRGADLRDELSLTSFRHGRFTEGADLNLTDAELRAAGRHRSAWQLPTYAKPTRKQLVSVATKRRAE
jgi:hypothetical protein